MHFFYRTRSGITPAHAITLSAWNASVLEILLRWPGHPRLQQLPAGFPAVRRGRLIDQTGHPTEQSDFRSGPVRTDVSRRHLQTGRIEGPDFKVIVRAERLGWHVRYRPRHAVRDDSAGEGPQML